MHANAYQSSRSCLLALIAGTMLMSPAFAEEQDALPLPIEAYGAPEMSSDTISDTPDYAVELPPISGAASDPQADKAMLKALQQNIVPVTTRATLPGAEMKVSSETLTPMTADSIGLAPAEAGVGPVDARLAIHQVVSLPVVVPSATLNMHAARYLAGEWPLTAAQPGAETVPGKLLAARAVQLITWGYLAEAEQLLALVPASMKTDEIGWTSVLLALVKDDVANGCAQATEGVTAYGSARFQFAAIYCHAVQGRAAEAQMGLDMLDEQTQQPDPLLREVVTSLNQKKPMKRASIPSVPGLWDQLLIVKAAPKKPLLDMMSQFASPLLTRLSQDVKADAAVQKAAQQELQKRTLVVAAGEWVTPARIGLPENATPWQRKEAARSYALLQALNVPLDATAMAQWATQTAASGAGETTSIPPSAEAQTVLTYAIRIKDPRAIVLAAIAALPADLAYADDVLLVSIVTGLKEAGLVSDARQFAAESIAAVGAKIKTVQVPAPAAVAAPVQDNLARPSPGAHGIKKAPEPKG